MIALVQQMKSWLSLYCNWDFLNYLGPHPIYNEIKPSPAFQFYYNCSLFSQSCRDLHTWAGVALLLVLRLHWTILCSSVPTPHLLFRQRVVPKVRLTTWSPHKHTHTHKQIRRYYDEEEMALNCLIHYVLMMLHSSGSTELYAITIHFLRPQPRYPLQTVEHGWFESIGGHFNSCPLESESRRMAATRTAALNICKYVSQLHIWDMSSYSQLTRRKWSQLGLPGNQLLDLNIKSIFFHLVQYMESHKSSDFNLLVCPPVLQNRSISTELLSVHITEMTR